MKRWERKKRKKKKLEKNFHHEKKENKEMGTHRSRGGYCCFISLLGKTPKPVMKVDVNSEKLKITNYQQLS